MHCHGGTGAAEQQFYLLWGTCCLTQCFWVLWTQWRCKASIALHNTLCPVHTRDRTSRDGSRGGMGWLVSKSRQQLSNGRGGSDEGVWDSSSPSTGPSCSSEEAEMPRFLPVTAIVQVPACSGITFGSVLVNYWICCRFHLNSGFAVVMAWVIALLIYVCYCNASWDKLFIPEAVGLLCYRILNL